MRIPEKGERQMIWNIVLWVIIIVMCLYIIYKEFEIIDLDPENPDTLQDRLDYLQKKIKGEKEK